MKGLNFAETRILRCLLDTTDPWEAAGRVRIDFHRYAVTLGRMESKGLVRLGRTRVTITKAGRQWACSIGLRSQASVERGIRLARKRFTDIVRHRPESTSLFDQGCMTPDSVLRRVEVIAHMGDADAKRVAILGDDDLLSVALCLACRPHRVIVFEIDDRIVGFILEVARKYHLPIDAFCRDLREPLPRDLRRSYHTVITDPSETIQGLKMFIGRGLSLLAPGEGRAAYFGLTSIEASIQKWWKIQRWLLNNYALAVTHVLPRNASYHNWSDLTEQTACFSLEFLRHDPGELWFNSSLVRLETAAGFRPKDMGRIKGHIFSDQEACGMIREEVK